MAPINELLAEIKKKADRLAIHSALVSAALFPRLLTLIIVQHLNMQLNDEHWLPFALVPFPDGSDPTALPVSFHLVDFL
jgi:hypothetical protein